MPNAVKAKLEAGRVSLGVWIEVMNAELVEICGYLGYDFAVLDAEHQALDPMTAGELVRACELCGMVPMVRVPYDHPGVINGFLEMGCKGVYVPHVSSRAQAEKIVETVKRPPPDSRGAGLNEETMVLALVEDQEGIDNLDEISSTAGVDVVGIGAADLANSMGHEGRTDHPEVTRAVQAAQQAILRAGRAFDAVVATAEEAEGAIADGALVVSVSVRRVIPDGLGQVLDQTAQALRA